MREVHITDDCIIYNDMDRGWVSGKGQPKWHRSLYDRWKNMWERCKDPRCSRYEDYKDCEIDERYRLLSNYINDIMKLENFNKLCEDPSKWEIDKDKKDPNNRCYFFEHLSIVLSSENTKERNNRCGNPNPSQPIVGINIKDNSILIFKSPYDATHKGFDPSNIRKCCKGIYGKSKSIYKDYYWIYLDINDRKNYDNV